MAKTLAFILSAALCVLAFMFSLVALAVVAVIGAGFAGWLWWKTRALRRAMRQHRMPDASQWSSENGQIIEGEAIRTDDPSPAGGHRLN